MSAKATMVAAAFALTTAITSPAPAQAGSRSQSDDRATAAYAYQHKRAHRVHRSRSVYDIRGHYRGADPDPFIRDQLKRCRQC